MEQKPNLSGYLKKNKVTGKEKDMKLLILLIGMVLIIEGLPYVAAPEAMQEWLKKLSVIPTQQLRIVGLIAMSLGLLICWVVQNYF